MTEPEEKIDAWMPLWIGAYLADTMHLSRDSHGGYLLLLFAYWRNRGPLRDDDKDMAGITKATPAEWRKLSPRLAKFFTIEDGVWSHGRADKELAKAGMLKRQKVEKAEVGGAARWGDTAAERGRHLRSQRMTEARRKGTHTAMEWEAMKAYHGMNCCRCGDAGEIVKDHIIPIYQEGNDSIDNLQPLCRPCNSSKGSESTDCRKDGWRQAIDALRGGIQAGIKCHTNACLEGIECLPDACPTPTPIPREKKEKPPPSSGVQGEKSPKPSKRCPADFVVTVELRADASADSPGVDIDRETRKFRDWTFAKPHVDWPATWRNWMREASDRKVGKAAQQSFREVDAANAAEKVRQWTGGILDEKREENRGEIFELEAPNAPRIASR